LNGSNAIGRSVQHSVDEYFRKLDGAQPHGVYSMVIGSAEKSLLQKVMEFTEGNQTLAAEILGLNRNTLRSKLQKHGIR
jgi:Fis family transcriptional regulator